MKDFFDSIKNLLIFVGYFGGFIVVAVLFSMGFAKIGEWIINSAFGKAMDYFLEHIFPYIFIIVVVGGVLFFVITLFYAFIEENKKEGGDGSVGCLKAVIFIVVLVVLFMIFNALFKTA